MKEKPSIELDDLTAGELMNMSKEELDMIPFVKKKWICQYKNCTNGTHIRDYGVSPWFMLDRNSKNSFKNPSRYWKNLTHLMKLCGNHYDFYMKMLDLYGFEHAERKLLKQKFLPEEKLIEVSKKNMITVQQIEK